MQHAYFALNLFEAASANICLTLDTKIRQECNVFVYTTCLHNVMINSLTREHLCMSERVTKASQGHNVNAINDCEVNATMYTLYGLYCILCRRRPEATNAEATVCPMTKKNKTQ